MKALFYTSHYQRTISLCIGIIIFAYPHRSFGQFIEFNQRVFLDNQSTILRNIMTDGDSLLISGEIGTDSMGLAGLFLFYADSLGNIGTIKKYRDPSLQDDALLDGRDPAMINANNQIVLSGHYLEQDDAFFMILNKQLDTIVYKEYTSNYRSMVIHGIVELNQKYYIIGRVQTINGDGDVFLQKIDSFGNKIWEKNYGVPSRHETGRDAIIEDAGLTLMISESFDPTPTVKNDTRYWIRFMHIDTSGVIQNDWKEEVTGNEGWAGTLLKYRDDYIYTTNTIGEETNFGPLTGGQIVRRDNSFNLVWRKKYGEPDSQFTGLGDMIFSADSCLLVTGQNVDSSMTFNSARIMKIGLDGHVIWELRDTGIALPDGQSLNIMEGIAASSCNSTYAVGYTYKSPGFYEGLILKVSGDGCIDTLCTTTDIENLIRLKEKRMLTYPNPARSVLQIRLLEEIPLPIIIRLYDMHGRQLSSTWINQYATSIDISGLPNGLYHVVAENNGLIIGAETMVKME